MGTFKRLIDRIEEKAQQPHARAVLYVAIGDSVTQGCMELGRNEHEQIYPQLLKQRIEQRFPATVFNVINSGVSGDSAHGSRKRWHRDVLMLQPDLVSIKFGLNDAHQGEQGLAPYRAAITELIQSIRSETEADILLMTPSMMMERDNDQIALEHRSLVENFIRIFEKGDLRRYAEVIRDISAEQNVPLLDIYAMWEQMKEDGIDIHNRLANGINHPDPEFHAEMAQAMEAILVGCEVE